AHAVVGIPGLHRRLYHPHLLHLGGFVWRIEPVRLHNATRSLAGRVIPDNGTVRPAPGDDLQHVAHEQRARLAISVIRTVNFARLTAWDTQRMKEMYSVNDDGTVASRKAIMGALALYLDFINLFLFLLRFLGDRR